MIPRDKLTWGKPCRKAGHQKADGTNLRHITGICMECDKTGKITFTDQDELYHILVNPKVPKRSPEEAAALRVAASMRWNAKNKDKTREYIRKYNKTPERKARRLEVYAAKSPEQKAAIVEQQRLRRNENPKPKFTPEEKRLRVNQRAREKYASSTPEYKAELLAKRREREARQKDKDGS